MGFASDSATIRTRFETEWAGAVSPAVAYFHADMKFTPPVNLAWVRLTVIPGQQTQVEMGMKRRYRRRGLVVVDIFVPAGSGDGLAKVLGDVVADIFMGRSVSGVVFQGTSLDRVGPDGPWIQYSSSTPFFADSLIDNPA